jgi:hypothetical protein
MEAIESVSIRVRNFSRQPFQYAQSNAANLSVEHNPGKLVCGCCELKFVQIVPHNTQVSRLLPAYWNHSDFTWPDAEPDGQDM